MAEARRRRARGGAVALAIVAGAFAVRCIDERDLRCENAVAQLQRCCPGVNFQSSCEHGCGEAGGGGEHAIFMSDENARCIVEASCEELVQRGACDPPFYPGCPAP